MASEREAHEVAVDAMLAAALDDVEVAVDTYLETLGEPARDELAGAVASLDQRVAGGDARDNSFMSPGGFGIASVEDVLGQSSATAAVTRVGLDVLRAEITLVVAARAVATAASLESIEALRVARAGLEAALEASGGEAP